MFRSQVGKVVHILNAPVSAKARADFPDTMLMAQDQKI